MSKTIKLEDRVYERLDQVRDKRQTFSEAVEKLLRVYDTLFAVSESLGPSHHLAERPKQAGDPM